MFTRVLISRAALRHNLRTFKKMLGPGVSLMPVIKANAYGHGFLPVAKICDRSPAVARLCVANLAEAKELIKNHARKPIQILSFFTPDIPALSLAVKNRVRFPVYTPTQARLLNRIGERCQRQVLIHLKIDIGTTRVGLRPDELISFIRQIKKLKYLTVEGVFSHFASSEDNPRRTCEQNKIFIQVLKKLTTNGCHPKIRHLACTAAATLHPATRFNAARVGLGIYGLYPSPAAAKKIKLRPVLRWETKILQIKNIPAGTKIGYGGSYTTPRDARLAVLPVGYFDGYGRELSSKGWVVVKNRRCPIRGKICMNLMMVEIPPGLRVRAGDRAELIGPRISADTLAKLSGTINYEITTRVNSQIPRVVI